MWGSCIPSSLVCSGDLQEQLGLPLPENSGSTTCPEGVSIPADKTRKELSQHEHSCLLSSFLQTLLAGNFAWKQEEFQLVS